MANEIYLYERISDYSAESFNRQLGWNEGSDVNIRMRTDGGFTTSGVAMLSGMERFTGKIDMSVDGDVSSWGAFMLLYADRVEMSDMAELMFHKVAYPSYYEPTPEQIANLKRENARLKKKMELRLGEKGAEFIAKVFAEELTDQRLTARQAKAIGLVDKIITLNPSQKAAYQKSYHKQMLKEDPIPEKESTKPNSNTNTINKMELTQERLDAKLAAAKEDGRLAGYAAGVIAGEEAKQAVIDAWNVFAEVDAEAVKAGLESGKAMTEADRNKFLLKASTVKTASSEENAEDNDTPGAGGDDEKTEAEKQAEANKKELEESCGIKLD